MANTIYLTITGKKQGLISSGCSTYDSIGNKYQTGHENEIYVYSFDHDISREQNVNHAPISITKPIDKSSPLLGIAISENESINCRLDFYRTSNNGAQEKYYSIEIMHASIKSISTHYPNSLTHNDAQPYEIISIAYGNITWKHHIAGTSGYSIWDERVS
ncbi:Hcp1 family type VI secretion system effector [Photorhabdus luminescens]|uniref:Hcp1 family type VI secretion system effector n=1 Tax=Photorhabdus akhurstii TaxID=171438 RepID=A0ABX8M3E7_9GAMM|nr:MULTISPECIES: Hcp family type VI secretion system effector [Photorhabdus]KGM28394.1 Hcp [Photorhabdus luminescens]MBS9429971.1 Hcp family type VI secretion system effector [Photorhabdus akhurstii]MBS9432981.1 Hcp family type VI secretion system effector [Photorhabdus hainanensis]MCC8458388.1 Hcp family type VI secretion system effector [Photorhabdus aegyptia]PQQ27492.1 type VI secretion system tube protein Hcp [Photorhabdus luminescens]